MAKYHLDEETKGLSLVDLDKFGVDKAEPWRNFSRLLLKGSTTIFFTRLTRATSTTQTPNLVSV